MDGHFRPPEIDHMTGIVQYGLAILDPSENILAIVRADSYGIISVFGIFEIRQSDVQGNR